MVITKDTLLHLNTTLYFDDEGYEFGSLEEARDHSSTDNTRTIRKQDCYIKHFDNLNEQQQDSVKEYYDDYKELLYLVGANSKEILLVFEDWAEFESCYLSKMITAKEAK